MRLLAILCAALAMGAPSTRTGQTPGTIEAKPVPDSVAPALADVRALVNGGRPAEALDRLTALDQADPRVRLLTGVALYHADRRREAIDVLERVRPGLPDDSIERRGGGEGVGGPPSLGGRLRAGGPPPRRPRPRGPPQPPGEVQ